MSDSAMVKNEYGKGIKGVGQGGGSVVLNIIIKQGLTHRWYLCEDLKEVKKGPIRISWGKASNQRNP